MFQVIHISNPFSPYEGMTRELAQSGITIRQWLRSSFGPDFVEFEVATICQLNGEVLLRGHWDTTVLKDNDVLAFVAVPGGVVSIVLAIIAIVVAVVSVLMIPDPKIPGDSTQSPNSVYTLRGQTNRLRPNEPVEVMYGKCRTWPTFITRPYSRYEGNLQYQYSLFCVGQGEFNIEQMRLDDTPLEDFAELEVEVCPPGVGVTLVESAVYQALEVSNIELLGPNQDDYIGPSGPFVINDYSNPIHRIEVDISFPNGLFSMNKKGKIRAAGVRFKFRARKIDEAGDPLGDWFWMWIDNDPAYPGELSVRRSDNTPQRLTFTYDVEYGRYEIEGQRSSDKPASTRVTTQARWEAVKGYAKDMGNFGDVTVIALKVAATNQLNDQTSKSFNLTATRKLPTWSPGGGWSGRVPTRNPIWAFVDTFKANYGAKIPDEYLDLANLYDLAQDFEAEGIWFDWIFDEGITPWEAAKTILRVGRAVPIPRGSLITAIRDVAKVLPSAVFNMHNILEGSLTKKLSMFDFQPFDALVIEYTDPSTWKTREVTCILPGRAGTNPDRLKLPGCTDRNRAYREGLYTLARREKQRKSVTFQTGLEGHIPDYMDLVSVTHDTVRVGQGGMVVAYDTETREMTLSQQVEFGSLELPHQILLRGPDGAAASNPITVTPGSGANKVVLSVDPPYVFDFSENIAPPLYAFGIQDIYSFNGRLIGVQPISSSVLELTVLNDVPECYMFDEEIAPIGNQVTSISNPSNPQVAWVSISGVPESADRIYVDFPPTPGAASYIIHLSYDEGESWSPAGTYPNPPVSLGANPGEVMARVAPFATGGSILYTTSPVYVVGSTVTTPLGAVLQDPQPAWDGLEAKVIWEPVFDINGVIIEVYDPAGPTLLREIEALGASQASYFREDFELDSPLVNARTLEFHVIPFNDGGDAPSAIQTLSNPVPAAPTGLTAGTPTGTSYPVSWSHSIPEDIKQYKVYASTVSGFTPGPANLVTTLLGDDVEDGTDLVATIITGVTTYWLVSAGDVWGPEEIFSTEATITI